MIKTNPRQTNKLIEFNSKYEIPLDLTYSINNPNSFTSEEFRSTNK
jgi:hypothetical protein